MFFRRGRVHYHGQRAANPPAREPSGGFDLDRRRCAAAKSRDGAAMIALDLAALSPRLSVSKGLDIQSPGFDAIGPPYKTFL